MEQIINDPYHSLDTKELHTELCKLRAECPVIGSNRENPHFKSNYADKEIILETLKPLLEKYGFTLTCAEYMCITFGLHLRTVFTHTKSGQWISSRSPLATVKSGDQEHGKTLTYRSRYSIVNLLCLSVSKDPADNDGEDREEEKKYQKKVEPKQEYITAQQVYELETILENHADIKEDILKELKIYDLYHMPLIKYASYRKMIEVLQEE